MGRKIGERSWPFQSEATDPYVNSEKFLFLYPQSPDDSARPQQYIKLTEFFLGESPVLNALIPLEIPTLCH